MQEVKLQHLARYRINRSHLVPGETLRRMLLESCHLHNEVPHLHFDARAVASRLKRPELMREPPVALDRQLAHAERSDSGSTPLPCGEAK